MEKSLYGKRFSFLLAVVMGVATESRCKMATWEKAGIGVVVAGAILGLGAAFMKVVKQKHPTEVRADFVADLDKKVQDYGIEADVGELFAQHGWKLEYDSILPEEEGLPESESAQKFSQALVGVMDEVAELRARQVGKGYGFTADDAKSLSNIAMDHVRYELPPKGQLAVDEDAITFRVIENLNTSAFDELEAFKKIVSDIAIKTNRDDTDIAYDLLEVAEKADPPSSFRLDGEGEISPTEVYLDKLAQHAQKKALAAKEEIANKHPDERVKALTTMDDSVDAFRAYKEAYLETRADRLGFTKDGKVRALNIAAELKEGLAEFEISPELFRNAIDGMSKDQVGDFWSDLLEKGYITSDNFHELAQELNQKFSDAGDDEFVRGLLDQAVSSEDSIITRKDVATVMSARNEPRRRAGASARSRNMESDEFAAEAEVAGEDTETVLPSSPSDTAGAVDSEVGSGRSGTHSEGERVGSAGWRGDDTLGAGEDDTSDRERKAQETREKDERAQRRAQQEETARLEEEDHE